MGEEIPERQQYRGRNDNPHCRILHREPETYCFPEKEGNYEEIKGDQVLKKREGKGMIRAHQDEQQQVCRECPSPWDIQLNPYISRYLLRLNAAKISNGMRSTPKSAIAVGIFCRAPMEHPPPPPPPLSEEGGSGGGSAPGARVVADAGGIEGNDSAMLLNAFT